MNSTLPIGRNLRAAFSLLTALTCASPISASAQAQPERPDMELIVPFGPGGGADALGRVSAALLKDVLSAPVQVVNVPGATGMNALSKLLAAPPDGRTLAVLTADTFALLAYSNPAWKLSDIIPLAVMTKQPSALFLPSDSRFRNWGDFEKQARLRPDTLRVAITGLGSPDYLALQLLAAKGVRLVPVPLSNPQERYRAPAEGKADALYEQPGDIAGLVAAQQFRPMLVFRGARLAEFPDVPSSKELGFGHGFDQFRAIVVRAGTEPATVEALSKSLEVVAGGPAYFRFLKDQGAQQDSYLSARNARAFMQVTLEGLQRVVGDLPLHSRHLYPEGDAALYAEPF